MPESAQQRSRPIRFANNCNRKFLRGPISEAVIARAHSET
jgi:hypothetical protein